jgi:hypothetical protein
VAALFGDDEDVTFWGSDRDEAAVGPEAVRAFLEAVGAGRRLGSSACRAGR